MKNIEFVDWIWQDYNRLKFKPTLKKTQIDYLFGTGLCETSDGIEYCFVPTMVMKETEDRIKKLYEKLHVTDHCVQVCNEVFYTSKIEGANTTIARTQEIHDGFNIGEVDKDFSESMILGGFNATKFLNIVDGRIDDETLIRMWNILVENACHNQDIRGDRYRVGDVGVGKHMGLAYQFLEEAMKNWIAYYNGEELSSYPFIKASLLHFAFEFIHPFCDGNGRCGRMLMMNYLIHNGYEKLSAVSFSRSIEKDRLAYDYAFNISDNAYTDCTGFIEYMLNIFEDALTDVVEESE